MAADRRVLRIASLRTTQYCLWMASACPILCVVVQVDHWSGSIGKRHTSNRDSMERRETVNQGGQNSTYPKFPEKLSSDLEIFVVYLLSSMRDFGRCP
jgi:hypothetical protein